MKHKGLWMQAIIGGAVAFATPRPLTIVVLPIIRESSKMARTPYNLCEGASLTGPPDPNQAPRLLAAIRRTSLLSFEPSQERAAIPVPAESSRLRRRCHRRVP